MSNKTEMDSQTIVAQGGRTAADRLIEKRVNGLMEKMKSKKGFDAEKVDAVLNLRNITDEDFQDLNDTELIYILIVLGITYYKCHTKSTAT